MHELSIAMSLAEGAADEASRHPGTRVAVVRVDIGRLSGVVRDALLFAYGMATQGTSLADSRLVVNDIEPAVYCRRCGAEREVVSIQHLACRECGTLSFEIVRGRELAIVGLELESEYAAAAG